mmetsp:Transcript_175091/g.561495  ORF Transcript_175091/g.561495 Transcript_175091/m.561495 type:complete len:269 (+) Transcript_175091:134-940(+)
MPFGIVPKARQMPRCVGRCPPGARAPPGLPASRPHPCLPPRPWQVPRPRPRPCPRLRHQLRRLRRPRSAACRRSEGASAVGAAVAGKRTLSPWPRHPRRPGPGSQWSPYTARRMPRSTRAPWAAAPPEARPARRPRPGTRQRRSPSAVARPRRSWAGPSPWARPAGPRRRGPRQGSAVPSTARIAPERKPPRRSASAPSWTAAEAPLGSRGCRRALRIDAAGVHPAPRTATASASPCLPTTRVSTTTSGSTGTSSSKTRLSAGTLITS